MSSDLKTNIKGNIIDGKLESYFRGRKLKGQEVDLPQGYRGVIVKEAGKETCLQSYDKEDFDGEEGEEEQEEATLLKEVGSFEKIVVWNHESMVNGDDAFVKGVSEWIDFAEAVSNLSISYLEPMTVADRIHRLDACTSRKESVKMNIMSFRFVKCELKAPQSATCLGSSCICQRVHGVIQRSRRWSAFWRCGEVPSDSFNSASALGLAKEALKLDFHKFVDFSQVTNILSRVRSSISSTFIARAPMSANGSNIRIAMVVRPTIHASILYLL